MDYLGDFADDAMLDFKWSSNDSAGASITRATNGTISVYINNGTTQVTVGVTDTEDFDSLTGVHHCRIDLSADAAYVVGSECQVVLSAATIDGQVVNTVLAHFSIERAGGALALIKARLPAALVSGRMDSSVGAMAANVVTAAAIATDAIDADAIADNAINAGAIAADAITAAKIADGAIDAATFAAGAITATVIADNAIDTATFAAGTTLPRVTLVDTLTTYTGNTPQTGDVFPLASTEIADIKAKTDNLPSDPADESSIQATLATIAAFIDTEVAAIKAKTDNLPSDPADESSIQATLATIAAFIDTEVAAIKAKTDNLPSDPADESSIQAAIAGVQSDTNDIQTRLPAALVGGRMDASIGAVAAGVIAAASFAAGALDAVWSTAARTLTAFGFSVTTTAADQQASADELLNRNIAGGGSGGARIVRDAFRLLRNLRQIVAGILTVMQEDDATPAWTASITQTAGDPVSKIDPA